MMYSTLANSAKSRLWISTPYLVPDEASMVALHMAKARGVDVRLLIPDRADHPACLLLPAFTTKMNSRKQTFPFIVTTQDSCTRSAFWLMTN